MAIDPTIPLQIRPPQQARSPLESIGRVMQLREAQQAQQLNAEQLRRTQLANQQEQQAIDADQRLKDLFASDPNPTETKIISAVGPRQAMAVLKTLREQQKAAADFQKADIETQIKDLELTTGKTKRFSDILGTVADQDSYHIAVGQALAEKLISPQEAQAALNAPWNEQTAARVKQMGGMALNRVQQLEQSRKAIEDARAQQKFDAELPGIQADSATKQVTAQQMQARGVTDYQGAQLAQQQAALAQRKAEADQRARDAAAGRAVTIAGQNKTDARQREMAEISRDTKPPAEAELRNLGFFERYKQANEVLNTLQESKNISVAKLKLPDWMNVALNADEQAYKQAERQLIEAYLRRDSGAAIAESEYQNARKTLGLDFGDKKTTRDQKARARETHADSLRASAGRAYAKRYGEPAITKESAPGTTVPKVGTVEDGYVYIGGDPSQKSSWKKK